jgi:hypothetical protein
MCLGGKSKSAPPPVPAPAQPTRFEYVNADTSNTQQRQAAINSTTNQQPSFGAELGASGTNPMMPAASGGMA